MKTIRSSAMTIMNSVMTGSGLPGLTAVVRKVA